MIDLTGVLLLSLKIKLRKLLETMLGGEQERKISNMTLYTILRSSVNKINSKHTLHLLPATLLTNNHILDFLPYTLLMQSGLLVIQHNLSPTTIDIHLRKLDPLRLIQKLVPYQEDYKDW